MKSNTISKPAAYNTHGFIAYVARQEFLYRLILLVGRYLTLIECPSSAAVV